VDQVGDIGAMASDAIKEVREIAYGLRPVELDRLGITKALRSMVKKVSTSTGIDIAEDLDDIDGLFSSESEINLYRIVQESINNIVKHSGASEAEIAIKRLPTTVSIAIRDNGRGFEPAAGLPADGRPAGFGLMGIAERARMLGGKPTVQSAPGRGTAVSISIELKENGNGR